MINRTFELLKTVDVPVKWNKIPDINFCDTVIGYNFFNEANLLKGDGICAEKGGSLQVDVYSKKSYESIVENIINLLEKNGFVYFEGRDDMENIDNYTALFHKVLIFNYIKSEVLKGE